MDEHIVRKEHMEAVRALSDINLEISKQKELLLKLQEEETQYLIDREKRFMERIKND